MQTLAPITNQQDDKNTPQLQNAPEVDKTQQPPIDFLSSVKTDSKKTQQILNDKINQTDTNVPFKQEINSVYKEPQAPELSEGVRYQKYRNTGVDYFDSKNKLTLLDALLARDLGLNVSWNYHKIDMKVDNKTRLANFTKAQNDLNKSISDALSLVGSNATLINTDKNAAQKARGYVGSVLRGYFLANAGAAERASNVVNAKQLYHQNIMNNGGRGAPTREQQETLDKLFGSNYGAEPIVVIKSSLVALQKMRENISQNMDFLESSGVAHPELMRDYRHKQKIIDAQIQTIANIPENAGAEELNKYALRLYSIGAYNSNK